MNDKPVAGIVTALVVAPLALLCCLGPIALGSVLAAAAGWLGGLGVFGIIGAALGVAAVGYGLLRRRARLRRPEGAEMCALFGDACEVREEMDRAISRSSRPHGPEREARRPPAASSAMR